MVTSRNGTRAEFLPVLPCDAHGRVPHQQTRNGFECCVCLTNTAHDLTADIHREHLIPGDGFTPDHYPSEVPF